MRQLLPWLIIAASAALRLALLFTTENHVDGDEAVVGVMAQHIGHHGARPLFYWGQPYGGGAAIEAWLAQVPFAAIGSSSISLKLVALALTLAALPAVYLVCRSNLGRNAALASLAIFATAIDKPCCVITFANMNNRPGLSRVKTSRTLCLGEARWSTMTFVATRGPSRSLRRARLFLPASA